MDDELVLNIRFLCLYKSIIVKISRDLTLLENYMFIIDMISFDYKTPIIVDEETNTILDLEKKVSELNLYCGMTLTVY